MLRPLQFLTARPPPSGDPQSPGRCATAGALSDRGRHFYKENDLFMLSCINMLRQILIIFTLCFVMALSSWDVSDGGQPPATDDVALIKRPLLAERL